MKKLIILSIIFISLSQLAYGQKKYKIDLDLHSNSLMVIDHTDPGNSFPIPIPSDSGIPLSEDVDITISDNVNFAGTTISDWKIRIGYNAKGDLSGNFTQGSSYNINYNFDNQTIKYTDGNGKKQIETLNNSIVIELLNKTDHPQTKIEFSVPEIKIKRAVFTVDLDDLQSCKTDYLKGLSDTKAEANLLLFSGAGPGNSPPSKIELFRNYKMCKDIEIESDDNGNSLSEVYRGKKKDFKYRKGSQLRVFSTNYNILNHKVDISSQGLSYNFENINLISSLQDKLPSKTKDAEKVSEDETEIQASDLDTKDKEKFVNLIRLHVTLSNDISELKRMAAIDYCMLSDYFLKIRNEMSANDIPTSLSQFSAYSDIEDEDLPADIKSDLSELVELYTELFTFASPPAPVFPTIIPNEDYHQFEGVVKSVKENQTVSKILPINVIIVGGWRHSISGNFLSHRLADEEYYLTDGEVQQQEDGSTVTQKQINDVPDENREVFAAGVQYNIYNQIGKAIGVGPSVGLASDIFSGKADRLRITAGVNFLLTTSIGRFGATYGIAFGNVSNLEYGYQVSTESEKVSYTLQSNNIPMRDVWKNSRFFGISYAFPVASGED